MQRAIAPHAADPGSKPAACNILKNSFLYNFDPILSISISVGRLFHQFILYIIILYGSRQRRFLYFSTVFLFFQPKFRESSRLDFNKIFTNCRNRVR